MMYIEIVEVVTPTFFVNACESQAKNLATRIVYYKPFFIIYKLTIDVIFTLINNLLINHTFYN